jgi:Zn-dependent M32 family carboxypeptidase
MKKMHAFQDRYFESVKALGFSRGIKGSRRKHKEVREFYRDIEAGMNAYDEFKKELGHLYNESKRAPTIWERLNPNSYFERLRPHFLKLIPMAKQVMAHQEILRADQKEDTIKKLSDRVRDLEHRFEDLVGGVPSWPQITKLRDELGRFKEFEGTIKLYEQNKKQFEDLTTPASDKKSGFKPKP